MSSALHGLARQEGKAAPSSYLSDDELNTDVDRLHRSTTMPHTTHTDTPTEDIVVADRARQDDNPGPQNGRRRKEEGCNWPSKRRVRFA